LGTVLLPTLSRAGRDGALTQEALNRGLELGLLLGLPASVGLAMLAEPIVTVLFERGAFGHEASLATAQVLAALALGLPAQVLAKVVAPAFFAREDTATPVRVAALAVAVNVAAALLLIPALGHVGLALALSLSSWVNALGLAWLMRRRGLWHPDVRLLRRGGGTVAAVLAMAAVLLAGAGPLAEPDLVKLTVAIGGAAGVFALAAWAAGAVDPALWRRAARA
jgi:putative peptidoglycan lipid II flippase